MSDTASGVREMWLAAVVDAGGDRGVAAETADELVAAYSRPDRRYHGLDHVHDVLRTVAELAPDAGLGTADRTAAVLAGCAHDVVYEGRPGDDERASAMWAGEMLLRAGVSPPAIARVQALVLITADHVAPSGDDAAAVLCDADLAVLGAEPQAYDDYVAAVRGEYTGVPDDDWRRGRSDVLRRLLAKEPLYATVAGRQRWENTARANLARELAALGG